MLDATYEVRMYIGMLFMQPIYLTIVKSKRSDASDQAKEKLIYDLVSKAIKDACVL